MLINLNILFSADEMPDDSDRDAMVANHLFYTRMTNVREVLLRLLCRGVISHGQKRQLVQKTHEEGSAKNHLDILRKLPK